MDEETLVSQKDSFSPGQCRLHPGLEVSEGKQNIFAPDCVCLVCGGVERLRVTVPYGYSSFRKSTLSSSMEDRQKILRQRELRQAANIDAFRDYTFKTFNYRIPGVQEAVRISLEFVIHPQGWLLFVGPCGCGKTHLAGATANKRLDNGEPVFFTTALDLLDALRAALVSPELYTNLYAWLREVELLVLDDLGAQQPSAWSNEKLLQLLNYRTTLALPTIITAIPKEFQGLDERLRSRLTDAQLVTTVIYERVKDYRPYKQAQSGRT